MNDYDRENLNFLLNASPEVLEDWYENVSEDDHEYAQELLSAFGEELKLRNSFNATEKVQDTTDAENVLRKYRL